MSRFNRTNFVKREVVDNKVEMQLVNDYFEDCFEIKRQVKYYQLEKNDVQHPDLLSIKLYGIQDYWWILCKINNIYDIWYDIVPGKVIVVPNVSDIEDFYTAVKKKQKDKSK